MNDLRSLGVTSRSTRRWSAQRPGPEDRSAHGPGANGTPEVEADYYVLAVPIERAVPLLNDDILAVDPGLQSLRELRPTG